jgi:hypothetical protein
MRLREWVRKRLRGELTRLQLATGVAYTTLHKLAHDEHEATYETAKKVSAATGGAVSIAELCELPRGSKSRKARKSRSTSTSANTSCAQPKLAAARP